MKAGDRLLRRQSPVSPGTGTACLSPALQRHNIPRGFTLVELIVVLIITGILGAIAATRFFDKPTFDAAAYAEQTRSLLRYAQKHAIAQNRPVFVVFGTRRIALCYNYQSDASCAGANRVLAPGGSNSGAAATVSSCASTTWLCEGTPANLALTLLPSSGYFYFDALGRPYASSDMVGSATSSFATTVLRITGDGRNTDVTVAPESGYVY